MPDSPVQIGVRAMSVVRLHRDVAVARVVRLDPDGRPARVFNWMAPDFEGTGWEEATDEAALTATEVAHTIQGMTSLTDTEIIAATARDLGLTAPAPAEDPLARPNRFPGRCTACGEEVPAGTGVLEGERGNWSTRHRRDDSGCDPRVNVPRLPPPPEATGLPAGNYLLYGTHYRVDRPTEGRWAGYVFLRQDGEPVRDSGVRWELLRDLANDATLAARRYRVETSRCCVCNRQIASNNPTSVHSNARCLLSPLGRRMRPGAAARADRLGTVPVQVAAQEYARRQAAEVRRAAADRAGAALVVGVADGCECDSCRADRQHAERVAARGVAIPREGGACACGEEFPNEWERQPENHECPLLVTT